MPLSLNSPVIPLDYTTGVGPWSDYGGGWTGGGYWKDPHGLVHLRGLVKAPAGNTTIAVLPPGFRPVGQELFVVQSVMPVSAPATQYVAGGQSTGYGPGTGNPINVFSTVATQSDPEGRMTAKGVYTCLTAGNYLITASASWTGNSVGAGFIGAINNTSGASLRSSFYTNSVIGIPGATGSVILNALAGETLSPILNVSWAATLNTTGGSIYWSVVQVDAPPPRVDVLPTGVITGASQGGGGVVADLGLSGVSFLAGV